MLHSKLSTVFLFILALAVGLTGVVACGDDDDDDNDDDYSPTPEPDDDDTTPTDDDDNDDDNNDDATPPDDDDDDDNDDEDTPDPYVWNNLSDELGEGEVRAGVTTAEDELIGGPRARARVGDYKMYNSKVEFIIRSPEHPGVSWMKYSGNVIDADRARPAGEEGADCLLALEQMIGLAKGFFAREAMVIKSGVDGEAIVRMYGKDGGMDIVDNIIMFRDYHLTIVNEYVLYPDVDYLIVRTKLSNETDQNNNVIMAHLPMWGDETAVFTPRTGYATGDAALLGSLRWAGGINLIDKPVSYAIATTDPEKKFYAPYIEDEILPLVDGVLPLPAGGEAEYEIMMIVGEGDTSKFPEVINEFDGNTEVGFLTGHVTVADGDLDGIVVLVTDDRAEDENYVAALLPDENGDFFLEVDKGDHTLWATGPARDNGPEQSVYVSIGETENVELTIGAPAYLAYTVTDSSDGPVPCKLTLQSGHNAGPDSGYAHLVWSVDGAGIEKIYPGDYTITASRGYEYEIAAQNITLTAGATTDFIAEINRVVDTSGHLCGEFHIHTRNSIDSQVQPEVRLRNMIAEGLEMPVVTDHDHCSNFLPIAEEMGVADLVYPLTGTEISPAWGHSNAWNLTQPDWKPDYYGIGLAEYNDDGAAIDRWQYPDIWPIARNDYGARIIQVNHPRDDTSGYFNWVGYDPTVGVDSVRPDLWSPDFDLIEVFNGGSDSDEGTLVDWFSFLDQGYTYTMVGNSDSHRAESTLGNPRSYFVMSTDEVSEADAEEMMDSLLAHRSQVSNGPFITFTIDGESIGGFVTGAARTEVDLNITIQAAPWVQMDYLDIVSNHGEVVQSIVLPASAEVIRYDDTVTLPVTADAYFVIDAGHSSVTLGPVNRDERVFAMTNPIWVDVDGNGQFDAPGIGTILY